MSLAEEVALLGIQVSADGLPPHPALVRAALQRDSSEEMRDAADRLLRSDGQFQRERLAEGQKLGERYTVGEASRSDFVTDTYNAFDERERRPVQLLVPRPILWRNRVLMSRFHQQAERRRRLKYRGLIEILDVGQENELDYIVIPETHAVRLGDVMDNRTHDAALLSAVVKVGVVLCNVLEYLHRNGIRKEVGPGNVLIDTNGDIYLDDIDLEWVYDRSAASEDVREAQLLDVSAPELRTSGEGGDARSDQFSLGALLRAILDGHSPKGPVDRVARRQEELNKCLARATAEQPEARYPDLRDLREALVALAPAFPHRGHITISIGFVIAFAISSEWYLGLLWLIAYFFHYFVWRKAVRTGTLIALKPMNKSPLGVGACGPPSQ